MAFEIFNKPMVNLECADMFRQLKNADYAVSDLPRDSIQEYIDAVGIQAKLHKLKDGRIKVRLI